MRFQARHLLIILFSSLALTAQAAHPEFSYQLANRRINTIQQDAEGFIWFGTARGLARYTGENFLTWRASSEEGSLNNDNIFDICFMDNGDMWLATECGLILRRDGLFANENNAVSNPVHRVLPLKDGSIIASGRDGIIKFDDTQKPLSRFFSPGMSWPKLIDTDPDGNIWVANEVKDTVTLFALDIDLNVLLKQPLSHGERALQICCSGDGAVWVATSANLYCFDSKTLRQKSAPAEAVRLLRNGSCLFLKKYGDNEILMGVRGQGLYIFPTDSSPCRKIHERDTFDEEAYTAFVDRDRNIWVAGISSGFTVYSKHNEWINHAIFLKQAESSVVRCLSSDSRGHLWMGVEDGYIGYDPDSHKIIWREKGRRSYTYLFIDSRDRIWTVNEMHNINRYNLNGGTPRLEKSFTFDSNIISICEDASGIIWIANNFGLHTIDWDDNVKDMGSVMVNGSNYPYTETLTDPESRRVFVNTLRNGIVECTRDHGFVPVNLGEISSINSLLTARDGSVWMGSFGDGLIHFYPDNGRIERFNISSGLSSNSIRTVIQDFQGRIWFSTQSEIICYDPSDGRFGVVKDRHFNETDSYTLRGAARTPDGRLWFGGFGGITEVKPDISFDEFGSDVLLHFQYIAINNNQISENSQKVILKPDQKLLTVMFSGLNFNLGTVLNYAYMLEGWDKDWTYTDRTQVSYSNLPAGKYTLRVKTRMMNAPWSRNELELPVVVMAPFYATLAAKIFYIIAVLTLAALLIRLKFRQKMGRMELAMKQEHIDFVTNISHDIRTPLSLIVAPIKELKKGVAKGTREMNLLEMMGRNAERLKVLSEEMMDTPVARSRDERLEVSKTQISALVHGICGNFRYAAMERQQQLIAEIPAGIEGYMDRLKVEKVLSNILSNAVKYTPEGGTIKVDLATDGVNATIRVADNGADIPKEKQDSIFNRFERVDMDKKAPAIKGSGIGLHYSYKLVMLHKGSLSYTDGENGEGSVFTLIVPIVPQAYTPEEISEAAEISKYPADMVEQTACEFKEGRPNILVAEDNPELSSFLQMLLSKDYNVVCAPDGMEAWENIKIAVPDLVISDIVMPQKDGWSLCADIRGSSSYCHIPVILLTSKTDNADRIKGMSTGADAYIGKPFDPDYLLATVSTLIANRQRIQEHVLKLSTSADKEVKLHEGSVMSQSEAEFLGRVRKVAEEHMEEENFSVEDLAREIGASYSKLYAKIKALTGQTPLQFINTFKMNLAMELLKSGEYTVSEVADKVGASSPFNFSRDFKKHFGVTPSSVK